MRKAAVVEAEVAPLDPFAGPAEEVLSAVPSRAADYLELTKPRIAVMALFTVGIGYLVGAGKAASLTDLFHVLLGSGLVAAGGSALNQWLERHIDAKMFRTLKRPLPAGRMSPLEALTFGVVLGAIGLAYLFATLPVAAGVAAAATFVSYVWVYTPLKTMTVWNTVVGAVPGALPPVIGWAAACGWEKPGGAFALFWVIFVWQLPHFLAIAWMYRDDYARGGLRMLPHIDPTGTKTAFVMVLTCVALIPVGWVSMALGAAGWLSVVGCAVLGLLFLREAVAFARRRTDRQARRVLRASLLYLPGALGLVLLDNVIGW
ncbi:heme o synthase [Urbifossiella limnaea]|uniref:Protoheme IX farnesyltransferase n=1 Tax=Urbifossiella limnaea TaxID=2528023 RepID=A0A517Y0N5_9BACT|nr:heme o synthase [Urbifossiella limnaea]QDU23326.1 Protoheme IX farnesyltransferase 1 [Urbifossiella limnaea]